MPQTHRALDWLVRRRNGESAALIAHRDGVPEGAVLRATSPYGPFPRPSHQLGRRQLSEDLLDLRVRRWVTLRRRGRSATSIAAEDSVTHQYVSKKTKDFGPFPAPEVVGLWVQHRVTGRTLAAIAEEFDVPVPTIRRHTAPYGPFRAPGHRLPEGIESVHSIARRVGLKPTTVLRWKNTGRLPDPDFVTGAGRQVWLPTTIDEWFATTDALETCAECGARCFSVAHHAPAHESD